MPRLQSLFGQFRKSTTAPAQPTQPRELGTEALKLVGGGLPRIGGLALPSPTGVSPDGLPRVG